jgi:hypothetical protein
MSILQCEFCEEEILDNQFYYVYAFVVETDKQIHYIGLQKIADGLADYLMSKPIHLSAGQILLFRPDIMKEFLGTISDEEKILCSYLQKYIICYECYEEYKEKVPLL